MKIVTIISLILTLGALAFFIYNIVKVVKGHVIGQEKHKIEGKERILLIANAGGVAFLLMLSSLFLAFARSWNLKAYEYFALLFGSLIFGLGLCFGIGAFALFYYKSDLDEKQKRICKYWSVGGIALLLGLWLFTEGVANHIYYPLISGFSFSTGAIRGGESGSGFKVKFYGIFIVLGALLCYGITDHMVYQKYKKHGLIDTLFIVAFFAGILGARLWYTIVLEPSTYFAPGVPPLYFLYGIVDGGLAVQGGAILGILCGSAFVLIFRKYMDLRFVMDVAIPTILLAQCIGRLGNFFNQEVYGNITSSSSLWYVPTIVKNNMLIDGEYRIPLFFIEATMNLGGYFIIRYLLGKVCKFHVGLGYQAACYLIWYGLVRIVLEPLREGYTASTSTEGFGYLQSYITAFAMMGAGILLIVGFYIYHRIRMNKGIEDKFGEKI